MENNGKRLPHLQIVGLNRDNFLAISWTCTSHDRFSSRCTPKNLTVLTCFTLVSDILILCKIFDTGFCLQWNIINWDFIQFNVSLFEANHWLTCCNSWFTVHTKLLTSLKTSWTFVSWVIVSSAYKVKFNILEVLTAVS